MKKNSAYPITFYFTDNCEKQAVESIAFEAQARGFPIAFSNNLNEASAVGFYCQHNPRPKADFSVILLHDLAQRHDIWPNFWFYEPWNEFDIGILPGKAWTERWKKMSNFIVAQPKLGVFEMGWPKADLIFKNIKDYEIMLREFKNSLNLKFDKTILYAPSWENDFKQDEFVKSLVDLPVNLLLKQAPWSNNYPQIIENIREMNLLHRNVFENVQIIDPEISIMFCIGASDLLVSDESSVLLEAALYGVPSLAVTDWLIPDQTPSRFASIPFDNIAKTSRMLLRESCLAILTNDGVMKFKTDDLRNQNFSCLGTSSSSIIDLIEKLLPR